MSDFNTINNNDFMIEKIKERPINRKKLIRRTVTTVTMAVIFGLVACFTILFLEPIISNYLYPEEEPEPITFVEDEDEMKPEDMLEEKEAEKETIIHIIQQEPANPQLDQEQVNEILEAVTLDKSHYIQLHEVMSEYVAELDQYMVTVTGVKEDQDWLANSYESTSNTFGVVIKKNNKDIFILTDYNTLKKVEKIQVTFHNGKKNDAVLMGNHTEMDIAILAVSQEEYGTEEEVGLLPEAPLGSSRSLLRVGDPIVALGSPMGVMDSLGYGMVTARKEETGMVDYNYNVLMTDIYGSQYARGILFNMAGEIVGVIAPTRTGTDMRNMVMAYGISDLKLMITALSSGKQVPYLGIKGTSVAKNATYMNENNQEEMIPSGAYVTDVIMNSPAMLEGLQKGDIIIGLDDFLIGNYSDFASAMYKFESGQTIEVTLMRLSQGTYKEMSMKIALAGAQ